MSNKFVLVTGGAIALLASFSIASPEVELVKRLPALIPTIDGYTHIGCYYEPESGGRIYPNEGGRSFVMTVQKCAYACRTYDYFGLEYGNECFCGNSSPSGAVLVAPENQAEECGLPCRGDPTQRCGGDLRIDIYHKNIGYIPIIPALTANYEVLGCYTRAIDNRRTVEGGYFRNPSDTTVAKCASVCNGVYYFGIEYGEECLCGNEILQGAVKVSDEQCDRYCSLLGVPPVDLVRCGGGNHATLFRNSAVCQIIGSTRRVLNPGFENGEIGWSTTTNNPGGGPKLITWKAINSAGAHEGRRTARIHSTSNTATLTLRQGVSVCPLIGYTLELWTKEDVGSGCTATISLVGDNVEIITGGSPAWSRSAVSFTASGQALELSISVICTGEKASKTFYIDNIRFFPNGLVAPPPPT